MVGGTMMFKTIISAVVTFTIGALILVGVAAVNNNQLIAQNGKKTKVVNQKPRIQRNVWPMPRLSSLFMMRYENVHMMTFAKVATIKATLWCPFNAL